MWWTVAAALADAPSSAPASGPRGLRGYVELNSLVAIGSAGLNVEYRRDWFAVSAGGGAGYVFALLSSATTASAAAQLHVIVGREHSFEIAGGAGPTWSSAATGGPRILPAAFVGYRYEHPGRGVVFRIGPGIGLASFGLDVSVGYHVDRSG